MSQRIKPYDCAHEYCRIRASRLHPFHAKHLPRSRRYPRHRLMQASTPRRICRLHESRNFAQRPHTHAEGHSRMRRQAVLRRTRTCTWRWALPLCLSVRRTHDALSHSHAVTRCALRQMVIWTSTSTRFAKTLQPFATVAHIWRTRCAACDMRHATCHNAQHASEQDTTVGCAPDRHCATEVYSAQSRRSS